MAGKKIIMTESMFKRLVAEETASKIDINSVVKSKGFNDAIRQAVATDRDVDKAIEKKIRKVVADTMKDLFRGMWERSNIWTNMIKK